MLASLLLSFAASLNLLGNCRQLSGVHGFRPRTIHARLPQQQRTAVAAFPSNPERKQRGTSTAHRASAGSADAFGRDGNNGDRDADLVAKASEKLSWELSEEKQQKPVLNLSLRDASPEEFRPESECKNDDDFDANEWIEGQRWEVTLGILKELGVAADERNDETNETEPWMSPTRKSSALLRDCPQLFRLEPAQIRETAEWIAGTFGTDYLENAVFRERNAVLLSFRRDDAEYALEFMTLMMMTDARPACLASSAFLVTAIEGGIRERAVGAALGSAGEATSRASRSIASDTMESFRQLRDATRNKK